MKDEILLFGGGGNYTAYYDDCKQWIRRYQNGNRCIVMPQTIDDDSVLNLSWQTTLIRRCLEQIQVPAYSQSQPR